MAAVAAEMLGSCPFGTQGCTAAWCDYLESHARRVFIPVLSPPQLRAAHELANKIKKRKLEDVFCCRDIHLKGWSGLDTPEAARQAVEVLVDARWLRAVAGESGANGGRPSERFSVNPGVFA